MSLRRILAEAIDPDVRAEIAELREAACNAVVSRGIADTRLLEQRVAHAIALAVVEKERDEARADVARLLEDAARCASENHTTPES